ncbi:hypothetical protein [Coxiella endosymbiont of Ornithodoros amblus]|nr:hypothetical protein [Coxiella endosymbiont of Ornithodoros amblus]
MMLDNQKARLYTEAETILYFQAKAGQVLLIKNARVTQKKYPHGVLYLV